jgi:hypothetical protein
MIPVEMAIQETPERPIRPRGARPSPRHKLAAAQPHVAIAAPAEFAHLSPTLHYWGNQTYGNCVPTESMAAKAADGFVATEAEGIAWAQANGWLNGAELTEVMDVAIKDGIPIGGQVLKDGPYNSVDWTDYPTLCSAIAQGQVKIGVAATQLENAVGDSNGWTLLIARQDGNIDHCTGLAGYGSLAYCCQQLGVSVPSGANPATPCVILFTWSTYGILSHDALKAITAEAWLRVPTTITPAPAPTPSPTPTPAPTPAPAPTPPTPVPPWCNRRSKEAATHLVKALNVFLETD